MTTEDHLAAIESNARHVIEAAHALDSRLYTTHRRARHLSDVAESIERIRYVLASVGATKRLIDDSRIRLVGREDEDHG